jgi:hypothetical protein
MVMNNELEGIQKKAIMVHSRYYYDTDLEGLRRTTKAPQSDNQHPVLSYEHDVTQQS